MTPTQAQINAGVTAGRRALENYSSFDSSMVPDDALETFVTDILTAVLPLVHPPQPPKPQGGQP
jgi:hypothetical protein